MKRLINFALVAVAIVGMVMLTDMADMHMTRMSTSLDQLAHRG